MKKKIIAIIVVTIFLSAFSTFLYFYITMKPFRVGNYEYAFEHYNEWYEFDFSMSLEKYYGQEKKVKIPSHFLFGKIKYISYEAFEDNIYIENVIIPDTVRGIRIDAFSNCSNLKYIHLSTSLDYIDQAAFYHCTSLSEIVFPESLEIISCGAFNSCTSLKKIYIPEKLCFIGAGAFVGCTNLTNVEGGDGLEEIEENAFSGTPWLAEYEGDFVQINNILIKYNGQEKMVVIPENIVSTSSDAFCDSVVEEIYLNNVTNFNLVSYEYVKTNRKIKVHFENADECHIITHESTPKSFIFCGPEESHAIQYAKENGIEYIIEE